MVKGSRLQVPAYTDAWMTGARYGTVTRVKRGNLVQVRLDAGFTVTINVFDCTPV